MTEDTNLAMQEQESSSFVDESESSFLSGFEESDMAMEGIENGNRMMDNETDDRMDATDTQTDTQPDANTQMDAKEDMANPTALDGKDATAGEGVDGSNKTITLRHVGREFALPKDAVATTAQALGMDEATVVATLQKGMNYDHIQNRLMNGPEMQVLDYYAKANGMSREQYVKILQENQQKMLLAQEERRLADAYPSTDPALLHELAEANLRSRQQEMLRQDEMRRKQEQDEKQRPWIEFFKAYPDMQAQDVPRDVYEAVRQGKSPIMAMLERENRQLKQQLEMAKQHTKNEEKAVGSVISTASPAEGDAALFMAGFNE